MAGPNYTNAFATVSPIKQNMADFVTDVENQDFKYRAEERENAKIKQEQKEKTELKQEKLRERILKTPTINSTGVQSLDELNGRVLRQAIDRKFEIYEKLSEGGLSVEEQTALEVENKNIDNLPENLKLGNDNIQNWFSNYDKQVGSGSAWQEENIDKKRKNGYDAFVPTLDERGLPLIGFRDLDGDGKIDPLPWENIKDGSVFGNLMPKVNYNSTMDNAAKALGTEEIVDQNGFKSITTKQVPIESVQKYADSMMFENGIVSPFTLSRARELGFGFNKEELSPEELKKIKENVINDILIRTDKTKKEDYDFGAANSASDLAERKRQFNLKRKDEKSKLPKEPSSKDFNNYTVIKQEATDKNDPRYGLPKGTKGYSFEGYNVTRTPAKDVEEKVESIYKTPNGDIVFIGKRTIGTKEIVDEDGNKSKETKTEDFTYSSAKDPEAKDFVSKIKNEKTGEYFKSFDEFKQLADEKEVGTKTKPKIDY